MKKYLRPVCAFPYFGGARDEVQQPGGVTCVQPAGSGGSEKCSGRGPVAYHERVFPSRISGVRADMVNQWNPNMAKNLHIIERLNMQLRLDALNVQNQSQMGGPTTDPPRPCLGKITSQTDGRQRLAAGAGAHHVLKSGGQKHP